MLTYQKKKKKEWNALKVPEKDTLKYVWPQES